MNPFSFHLLFLFLLTIFSPTSVSSSTSVSYSHHCSSLVSESIPTVPGNTIFPDFRAVLSPYAGSKRIPGNVSSSFSSLSYFSLQITQNIFETKTSGVYKINQAYLLLQSSNLYSLPLNSTYAGFSSYNPRNHKLRFKLNGFWSQNSGKICMVGSASWYSKEGHLLNLDAVLKLNYTLNSTIVTSLITGKLESLSSPSDASYFKPVPIMAFSSTSNYNYTMFSGEFDGGIDIPRNQSLGLQSRKFCSVALWRRVDSFKLEYPNECNYLKNCTLFDQGNDYLPPVMSLKAIQCSENDHKVQYLLGFGNSSYVGYFQPFDPATTLVAEGSWDENKNQLSVFACRILNSADLGNARVGDCSIRLSLRYPAFWSIRNRASIVGQIWTNKTVNDSGYFNKLVFGSYKSSIVGVSGLKYEYTEIDRVRNSCLVKKPVGRKGERYPKANSYDMRFDMSVEDSMGKLAWGYAFPIFVGDQPCEHNLLPVYRSEVEANSSYSGALNISYKISIRKPAIPISGSGISANKSSLIPNNGRVEISAEGVYDDETGNLCMVGCRKLVPGFQKLSNDSMDCELLLKFHFPPTNAKKGKAIKGRIESKRKNTDPLYFERLTMSSTAFYTVVERKIVWRMDLEITMVLISNTLACVFVGLQLYYVKKNLELLPSVSLLMLVILTFGHMIPLVLNFEALFLRNRNGPSVLLANVRWLEANEVIVRVVTMVAFLLQFRLLQLAWTQRLGDENQKSLWIAEKKALFVSIPLHIVGVLVALLLNFGKSKFQQHSLWGALRSYGGLVLDGFLFPQILLNIIRISGENALSPTFYFGITLVRLLPHAYDLYRAQNYAPRQLNGSYFYANPNADFYSSAWDVVISCGGVLFAVIIYLQQRFGGRCFLPRRFREAEVYEKVPVVSSE